MESAPDAERPKISIDVAHPNDASAIQEVFYRTWLATYPNEEAGVSVEDIEDRYKDKLTPEGIETYRKRIEEGLEKHDQKFLTAKIGEKIVGVCLVTTHKDKNQLNAIYVLPEYQGRGVGRQLWDEALKFIDPTKDTTVEVVTYNDEAIKFYERLGFKATGRRWADERFKMKSGAMFPEMEMRIAGSGKTH